VTWTATLGRDDVSDRMGPNNLVMGWKNANQILFRSRRIEWNDFRGQLFLASLKAARSRSCRCARRLRDFSRTASSLSTTASSRVPHVEALPRRPGRRRLAARLRHENHDEPHEQQRPGHHPDVEGIEGVLRLRPGRPGPDEPLQLRPRSKQTRRLTSFTEFDVKFPSMGDAAIVFENGG